MENYPDRKSGSHFGWWKTSASDMGYDYIVPSENGSRSNCQQICFESSKDGGLAVIADPNTSFSCSALLHSAEELYHASHTCDLDQRVNGIHPIYVNVDHQLMGVGGDDSWSPCVYPDFVVKSQQEYNYKVWFVKISPEENH
jgi:beta-galactosidase